jgi:hypothetical protein
MTSESNEKPREWRIVRHSRILKRLAREPSLAGPLLRDWLVALWATKGGGFYGLGYVVTLVALEIFSLERDVTTNSASTFVASQAIQYLAGFGVDSILNTVRAAVWPFYLFKWLGPPGFMAFLVGVILFERLVRPAVEARLPELAAARAKRLENKQRRRERKRGMVAEGETKSSAD